MSVDLATLSLEDIDSVSSVGRDCDTVAPLPPPIMPSWGMPYAPARPSYAPSYLSPVVASRGNYGPPSAAATPYNFVNDSVSYVSMPGMNGAESVASGMYVDRLLSCCDVEIVTRIRIGTLRTVVSPPR